MPQHRAVGGRSVPYRGDDLRRGKPPDPGESSQGERRLTVCAQRFEPVCRAGIDAVEDTLDRLAADAAVELLVDLLLARGVPALAANVRRVAAVRRVAIRRAHSRRDRNFAQAREVIALFGIGCGHAWSFTREPPGETKQHQQSYARRTERCAAIARWPSAIRKTNRSIVVWRRHTMSEIFADADAGAIRGRTVQGDR